MPDRAPTPPARTTGSGRRRASHSLEAVVDEAIALLDEAGEPALTFRALAARLGGGVASIYWYVASKEELLDRASDRVLDGVLADTAPLAAGGERADTDPIEAIRTIAVALFDAVVDRPWLGAYFMRTTSQQPNSLRLFERIGQQVMRLRLGPQPSFDATSAVIGYVIGTAADLGQQPPPEVLDGSKTRDQFLAEFAEEWRALDAEEYPFIHHIVEVFADHDDAAQFRAGLDLLLAGLRLRAGGPSAHPAT